MRKITITCIIIFSFLTLLITSSCHPEIDEYEKGIGYFNAGNYKNAVYCFNKAIEIKPDFFEAKYYIAISNYDITKNAMYDNSISDDEYYNNLTDVKDELFKVSSLNKEYKTSEITAKISEINNLIIEIDEYKDVINSNSLNEYEEFLKKYPNSKYKKSIEDKICEYSEKELNNLILTHRFYQQGSPYDNEIVFFGGRMSITYYSYYSSRTFSGTYKLYDCVGLDIYLQTDDGQFLSGKIVMLGNSLIGNISGKNVIFDIKN